MLQVKFRKASNKKASPKGKAVYIEDVDYLTCFAYLVLNLSIRPAVSISFDLPV